MEQERDLQRAAQVGAPEHVLLLAFLARTALRMGGQAAAGKMLAVLPVARDLVQEAQTMLPCCQGRQLALCVELLVYFLVCDGCCIGCPWVQQ